MMFGFTSKALLIPLALIFTAPAWSQPAQAQDQLQKEENARGRNQQHESQSRHRQRGEQEQRENQSDQRRQRQQRDQLSDRKEARTHYRAGLVAGYMLGYADGLDDYVLVIGNSGAERSSNQNQDDGLHRQLRDRARREMTDRNRGKGRRSDGMADSRQQQQRVSGEIASVKRIRLQNDQQQHLVALIKTNEGKRRIVDLGPTRQLQDLDIGKGDKVTAEGGMLRTRDGVPVVNARRVKVKGETVTIRGKSQQQGQRRRQRN